jgi:hypothetical protein
LDVALLNSGSLVKVMPFLKGLAYKKNGVQLSNFLFSSSASFFAYSHVLESLKEMHTIPLGRTLVHLAPSDTPPNLAHGSMHVDEFGQDIQRAVAGDETQRTAFQLMCESQVVLVQGPPGTGKTYIGVQMVKAMLEAESKRQRNPFAPKLQILCLCYTNHALDSFLEALMDVGIPTESFVRLGSSPKISARLKPRCLRELEQTKFTQVEGKAFGVLKREAEDLEEKLKKIQELLNNKSQWGGSQSWWRTVQEFLEDEYYEELEQLRTPSLAAEQDGGFQTVTGNNKAVTESYLWEQWYKGKDRGIFNVKGEEPSGIWAYKTEQRKESIAQWNAEWLSVYEAQMATVLEQLTRNSDGMLSLRMNAHKKVLP